MKQVFNEVIASENEMILFPTTMMITVQVVSFYLSSCLLFSYFHISWANSLRSAKSHHGTTHTHIYNHNICYFISAVLLTH